MLKSHCLVALTAFIALPAFAADIQVRNEVSSDQVMSGRLLVIARRVAPSESTLPTQIDIESFSPEDGLAVMGRDVDGMQRGATRRLDDEDAAWPTSPWKLPAGDYWMQALLDTRRDYGHFGRGGGDLTGPVRRIHVDGRPLNIELTLDRVWPAVQPWVFDPRTARFIVDAIPHARANARPYVFNSSSVSAFFGRPVDQRGWVLLPPGYDARKKYPTVYSLSTYSGDLARRSFDVTLIDLLMARGDLPAMVWVFPDYSVPGGTHEFVDSVNNGPWDHAFVDELIPWIEGHYAVDTSPCKRLLTGHSSGGWSSLWLQVHHPETFGGTWSTGPDPIDFHSFLNVDIYADVANAYRFADGTPIPAARARGKVVARFEDVARIERVLGGSGGQLTSFEWTYSPRGDDGRPMPLFDDRTGAVDKAVASAWASYDIVAYLRAHPDPRLRGKLHVIVGAEDNYYLDGAVRRLAELPDAADVRILPGRTHNNLYQIGDDPLGFFRTIGHEMSETIRNHQGLQK
ncbi:MAG: hypothetical protein GAK28_03942 [Luteibacter sp.]|uniref:alpha/beta hydrolase n=1 Tax=Luteibacter sp. TaxID=1886636 RepID=UPI00138180EE|nr:alpha/beta hydrolase-fold protein [Luteibacter sp.]KAF1004565.1 MAG: hypothetical protein GAK28_03942 [Luteibacter sp.]